MPRPPSIFRGERPPRAWQRGMSIRAFCETYDVGRTKAYEEINAGRLRALKAGRRTIVTADDAEAWLSGLPELKETL